MDFDSQRKYQDRNASLKATIFKEKNHVHTILI